MVSGWCGIDASPPPPPIKVVAGAQTEGTAPNAGQDTRAWALGPWRSRTGGRRCKEHGALIRRASWLFPLTTGAHIAQEATL